MSAATRPRVKICGLTRAQDVALAVSLGADELGVVLAPESPRCVSAQVARELLVPFARGARGAGGAGQIGRAGRARGVLVFRTPTMAEVLRAVEITGIRDVQLHRTSAELAASLSTHGCRVRRAFDAPFSPSVFPLARTGATSPPIVFDVGGGGSGQSFPKTLLAGRDLGNAYVAGGLDADRLDDVLPLAPLGIDLSSRLERRPGVKDAERLRDFFHAFETRLLSSPQVTSAKPDRIR